MKKNIENYKKKLYYLYYICLNKNNSLTQIYFLYTSQKNFNTHKWNHLHNNI